MKIPKRLQITAGTLWQVAGRSLFLQTCWNFQKMQNLGFAYALTPVIRAIYPSRLTRVKALKRHLDFFVTHPYCASVILGVVARMEEQNGKQGGGDSADSARIKAGMMGPLAALGDTLFWATLKPLLALLGSAWVLIAVGAGAQDAWLGPVFFVVLFSVFHFFVRVGGLWLGYARGLEIIKDLRQLNPQRLSQQLGHFAAMAAAVLAAFYFKQHGDPLVGVSWPGAGAVFLGLLSVVLVVGLRRGLSPGRLIYGLVALSLLAAYLFKLG